MWAFGSVWVLETKSVLIVWMGRGIKVLGLSSLPNTVRKPPNWMSSGSGLGSWDRTPISTVDSSSEAVYWSVHPTLLGESDQTAVQTTA